MKFTDSERKEIEKLRKRYPESRSLVLPLMWMLQKRDGYISDDAVHLIAGELDIPPIWVEEVRSWYSMFSRDKEGTFVLEICNNLSCSLMGSQDIIDYICDKLKIKVGETTKDGTFTVKTAECLGSCGTGPMMQVGDMYYEMLDEKKVDEILDSLSKNKTVEQKPQEFPEYK